MTANGMLQAIDEMFASRAWKTYDLPAFEKTQKPPSASDIDFISRHGKNQTSRLEILLENMSVQNSKMIQDRVTTLANGDDEATLNNFLALALEHNLIAAESALSLGAQFDRSTVSKLTEQGNIAGLQLLLRHGWDIDEPLSDQQPPALSLVVQHADRVSWFLAHGADPDRRCKLLNLTPLSEAIRLAPLSIIERMLRDDHDVSKGELLHHAVHRINPDKIDIMNLLFNRGARINRIMYHDDRVSYNFHRLLGLGTALHEAAKVGDATVVRYLLARGADTTIRNTCDELPEEVALLYGHLEAYDCLRDWRLG